MGTGSPLVLLHGVLGSETMWRRVLPLVAPYHDTIAFTALGHRGGHAPSRRPARVADVVDDAERVLVDLGIDRAHLAGNSLGGWIALELARRGRALSVCVFSPAGCWKPNGDRTPRAVAALRATMRQTRIGRFVLPILARWPRFRQRVMRLNAVHGDSLRPAELVELADDLLGCSIGKELLQDRDALAPLDPLPCPVTIAWGQRDKLLPLRVYGDRAKELMPQARFVVLEGVGHVAMFDAPDLVARTILECTGSAATVGQAGAASA
jgi:pimeloyl-ACP methyl ester carboxylesterase